MTILRREERANLGSPGVAIPLNRWDPTLTPPAWGTNLWAFDTLKDMDDNVVDFCVPAGKVGLLEVSGRMFIRNKCTPLPSGITPNPGYSDFGYGLYANARVILHGPATTKSGLPTLAATPTPTECMLSGQNISNFVDHYANIPLSLQKRLLPGYYALELWCSAGTDLWDVDGLGELGPFNCGNTDQLNVKLEII